MTFKHLALVAFLSLSSSSILHAGSEQWIPLFDGKTLEGWTPKFAGHEIGKNPFNTFRYQKPQLDPEDGVEAATPLLAAGVPMQLSFGHIALQAEGQGVWFRNIELLPLGD